MRVPVYEQQVRTNALPGVRQNINTTAADFGGAQAQALQQAGSDLGKTADTLHLRAMQRAKEDNETAVMDAYTKLSTQERDYLYGENGVMTKAGANALGATANTAKDVGAMAEQISGTLANDEQRKMFKQMYQRRLDSSLDAISRYEAGQRKTYQDSVTTGLVKNAAADAETRWNDPTYIGESSRIAATAMAAKLRKDGVSEDLISFEVKSIESTVWKGAIEQAIQYDPMQAERLLKENRDKMSADDAADMDKALKAPLLNAKASAYAAEAFSPAKGSGLPAPVSSLIAQNAAAKGVSPRLAMVIARLEGSHGDVNARPIRDGKLLSDAVGIYQFKESTWKEAGGTDADRFDLKRQVELGVDHIAKNTKGLRDALGREPTEAEVYLAHQQGLKGATALLTAADGQFAIAAIAPYYKKLDIARQAIVNNGGAEAITAKQFVDKWASKYARLSGSMGVADMSRSEAIEYVKLRAGGDAELASAAIAKVEETIKQAKEARQERTEQIEMKFYDLLTSGDPDPISKLTPQEIQEVGPKKLYELQGKGRNVKTDWSFYNDYMAMTPNEKASVPLPELQTRLGSTELKKAIEERVAGKKGTAKVPSLAEQARINKEFAITMGLRPAEEAKFKKDDASMEAYAEFTEYMNNKMDEYREKHATGMPIDVYRKEAGLALMQVVTKKNTYWFDEKKRGYELAGAPAVAISSIKDLPVAEKMTIEKNLRDIEKVTPTDSLVLDIALAKIRGDAQAARLAIEAARKAQKK